MYRTEKLLHKTLSMLCNFVWTGQTRQGDHMWSIPADRERDFDMIISDAIAELVARRKAMADPLVESERKYEEIMNAHRAATKKHRENLKESTRIRASDLATVVR